MKNDTINACVLAWQNLDLSTCKPLGFDASTWIAALTALVGIIFFAGKLVYRWMRGSRVDSDRVSRTWFRSRFRNLCRTIEPLMAENYRIFCEFGPNGGKGDGRPKIVRHNLGAWYNTRGIILQNNDKIKNLIKSNFSAIPKRFKPDFEDWLNHIDAFNAHVADSSVTYRNYQFPCNVSAIISDNA